MTEDRYKEGIENIDTIIALLKQQIALYAHMKDGLEYKRDKERKQHGIQKPS
jgi:hypothetical protein